MKKKKGTTKTKKTNNQTEPHDDNKSQGVDNNRGKENDEKGDR